MVKLSIVVPVYNVEEFLAECIDSILRQTYKDWELILVNDGSTDCSQKICEQYCNQDTRIRLINKNNGGLSSARNSGIEQAQGEFITFIDSDDVIVGDDVLERLINCFMDDKLLDVVQYDVIFKWLSNDEHHRTYPFMTYTSKDEILKGYLEENIHVSCCDKVFRTSVFKNIRFPLGQISEDIAIIPQLIENMNRLRTTDIGYYGYRYREGSISRSVLPYWKILSILKSYYTYLSYAMNYEVLRPQVVETFTKTLWSYVSLVRRSYPNEVNEFCKQNHFIKLSFKEWYILSLRFPIRLKITSFITCVCGGKAIFIFQKFFTRK